MNDDTELGQEVERALDRENNGAPKWRRAHVEYRASEARREAEVKAASESNWAGFPKDQQ